MFIDYYKTPIGLIELIATRDRLISLNFMDGLRIQQGKKNDFLDGVAKQLDEYFKGKRKDFEIDLYFAGTEFQKKVWNSLTKIPFGVTRSYKDIAEMIGNKNATRAVGNANNRNSLPIIVPCHRVIGSDGSMTGYAGGIERKEWLLTHEKIS